MRRKAEEEGGFGGDEGRERGAVSGQQGRPLAKAALWCAAATRVDLINGGRRNDRYAPE